MKRQDAWSEDEDLVLAEVVLRHIREGETQLAAFEEVGRRLSRTAAACGFRWNSAVRKKYKSGIEIAKKQRKSIKKQVESEEPVALSNTNEPKNSENEANLETIITLLQQYQKKQQSSKEALKQENEQLRCQFIEMEEQLNEIKREKEKLEAELKTVREDYVALIEMMERARKRIVLQEDE